MRTKLDIIGRKVILYPGAQHPQTCTIIGHFKDFTPITLILEDENGCIITASFDKCTLVKSAQTDELTLSDYDKRMRYLETETENLKQSVSRLSEILTALAKKP